MTGVPLLSQDVNGHYITSTVVSKLT